MTSCSVGCCCAAVCVCCFLAFCCCWYCTTSSCSVLWYLSKCYIIVSAEFTFTIIICYINTFIMFEVFLDVIIVLSHRSQRARRASSFVKCVHKMLRFADLAGQLSLEILVDSTPTVEELQAMILRSVELLNKQAPFTRLPVSQKKFEFKLAVQLDLQLNLLR